MLPFPIIMAILWNVFDGANLSNQVAREMNMILTGCTPSPTNMATLI